MTVHVTESAGLCFGVDRVVQTVFYLLNEGKQVYTLGPIVHNPQIVQELGEHGVRIVDIPTEVPPDDMLVIRSHGVTRAVQGNIFGRGLKCADTTCPFVHKIHRIVSRACEAGQTILIAGDASYPEIEGMTGYCAAAPYVFRSTAELGSLPEKHPKFSNQKVCVIVQATFGLEEWENCLQILKKVCTNADVFAIICNATIQRQSEASDLTQKSDLMLVIGGRHGSSTAKLRDVCAQSCTTYLIEKAEGIPSQAAKKAVSIGIITGASTPASIIKEVPDTMAGIIEGTSLTEQESAESDFEEILEEFLRGLNIDEKVHSVVVGTAPNETYVNIERKQAGFVPLSELSTNPNAKTENLVRIGDELDLLAMRTSDQGGTIILSEKRLDVMKGWETISETKENETVLTGVTTEVIKGGVTAVANGVCMFIPASQATASRNDPLDALLRKGVKFRIIGVNRQCRRAVGFIRSVLKNEKKGLADKFWEAAEEGREFTGVVKSPTAYSASVDLDGINGMVHISELSWNRIKHPSEIVNVGDTIKVYIKGLDKEEGKTSLGYKKDEGNPWEILKKDYPVGTIIEVQVVGLTTFGAFARIIPDIDGLIYISQITNHRIEKPQDALKNGDKIKAKITDIDFGKRRVNLSTHAYLERQAAETAEETPVAEDKPADKE